MSNLSKTEEESILFKIKKGPSERLKNAISDNGTILLTTNTSEVFYGVEKAQLTTSWKVLRDKPASFTPSSHKHNWSDINNPPDFALKKHNHDDRYYTESEINTKLANFPSKTGSGASGTWGINITGSAASANAVDWSNISNKPSSFKPSSHTHTLFNNALSFNIKISEHSSPGDQPLFINCAEPSVDVTLKNAPGIGFHVANKGWANFIFMPEDNSFRFVNSSLTSYVPIYASTIHGTLIGNVDWSNITNKANSYYSASQCTSYNSDDRGTTPAAVKKAFTIFEPKAHTHSQYVTWNHNANGLNVSMIQYRDNPVNDWGHGIGIGGGGLSVLGGGESATVVLDNRSPSEEIAIVASDGDVEILTNLQSSYASRTTFKFNTVGNFFSPNGIFPSTKDVGDLGNFNHRWKRLWTKEVIISGASSSSISYNSNVPRVTFMEENGIQPVQILYTDADAYRAPAGLKICGGPDASPSWLEVQGDLYASHLRADYLRGAIMLSNNAWTSYGTATPDSSYTAKEGRLYFKII